jgi:putative hemolysin
MLQIGIIFICLCFNAILSCIEMAFVTVSKPLLKKMVQQGSGPAARILALKKNPERVLSVLQIGITLVGAVSAAVGGAGAEEFISPQLIAKFQINAEVAAFFAIALVVIPLTYVSVVIGELVPKSLALKYPLQISLWGGYLLIFLDRFFAPFVFILEVSTRFLTHFIFSNFKSENLIELTNELDIDNLTDSHKQYVLNLIGIHQRVVKDVMVDWDQVSKVNATDHYHDVLELIRSSRHTRFPVMKDDQVIGLLHAKEFVSELEIAKIDWTNLIRDVVFLHLNEPLVTALKKLQTKQSHLAVIKPSGGPLVHGIVTIEDIIEEVVGDIYDEDDSPNTLLALNSRMRTMPLEKKR